ncbi:MAG: acyl carrier protein [Calditrichaeota bacterium]|jgi:acyl carrier protein|nr:acyl carrier protein [Calditrichota bacterium]
MEKRLLLILNKLLKKNNRSPLSAIRGEMDLREEFGFDSLDLAELTVLIESEFEVDIFEDGIVKNVQDILTRLG